MNNYEFLSTCFLPKWNIYILSLVISIVIYIPIFIKTIKSIFDPMFFALISAVFANSVPIFLLFINIISWSQFIYIVLCEATFWITYFVFAKKQITFSHYEINENNVSDLCYFFFFAIMLISNLVTYAKFGIPILMESRLETYSAGGGWGILMYFDDFAKFFCTFYAFYCISIIRYKLFSYVVFFFVVIFSLLSGSKSSILVIVYSFFFYKYYYQRNPIKIRKYLPYLAVLFFFPIALLTIQRDLSPTEALLSLLYRFVANGDVYWMALPNDIINDITIHNKVIYLFSRILAPFRLISHESIELPIGVQLTWLILPGMEGQIVGPNTRLSVLCWVLFKWNGIPLAAVFGLICALWRTRLPRILPRGILTVIIYGYIYMGLCAMFTDPLYATSYVFSITLFLIMLYVAYIFFGGRYIKLINSD